MPFYFYYYIVFLVSLHNLQEIVFRAEPYNVISNRIPIYEKFEYISLHSNAFL